MIPLKLHLKNFLCYGEDVPTLDFQGINLACLCGQNGHGKTAILEAITWSLWGKGRAQTQQEFVRIGQRSMSVELEFACRDEKYRVLRTFSKPCRRRVRQQHRKRRRIPADQRRAVCAW